MLGARWVVKNIEFTKFYTLKSQIKILNNNLKIFTAQLVLSDAAV